MSTRSNPIRDEVVRRACNRCEYCQLPAQLQIGGFQVDHILPRSQGGQTDVANLAWACPHCNARKWAYIDGEDPMSGQAVALFNPKTQVWADHFSGLHSAPSKSRGSPHMGERPWYGCR
jgi:5-methylcytosine-specific restriction endonuclease McrA